MTALAKVRNDLVNANRILGNEGILDAFGHVSARVPEETGRFLLSRARSPELVEEADLLVFDIEGTAVAEGPASYIERYIHAAIYAARPDVSWVCHNHALSMLPYSISETPMRAVIHTAGFLGTEVPVWDLVKEFPGEQSLLVRNLTYGASLAKRLGLAGAALLRGHGSVVVAGSAPELVSRCISMDRNARVQQAAQCLGTFTPLGEAECEPMEGDAGATNPSDGRDWEYFRRRAGLS